MLSKKQIKIIKSCSNYEDLVKNYPEITFLIKKHKITHFYSSENKTRLPHKFWTKDLVFTYGKLCQNRYEFNNLFPGAYDLARIKGWMAEIMKGKKFWIENIRKYTLKSLLNLCKKENFTTYAEFLEKYPSAYQQAYQQGWTSQIKDFFKKKMIKSMPKDSEIARKLLNKELLITDKVLQSYFKLIPEKRKKVFEIIKEHNDKLKKENKRVISRKIKVKSIKNKFKIISVKKSKHNIRYKDEEIFSIAKQYKNRQEFQFKHKGAYEAAIRRNILNKVCEHMIPPYESLGEQLVRKAFDYHFDKKFYKIKPAWLINPSTGRRLELDGFNDELRIAFEVQGEHHFIDIFATSKSIKLKDEMKVKKCKELGIDLYVIVYKNLSQLESSLHELLGIPKSWLSLVSYDLREKLTEAELNNFRQMINLGDVESSPIIPCFKIAEMINVLRKNNLPNKKVEQVLGLTGVQLKHRISRINQLGIPLIQR